MAVLRHIVAASIAHRRAGVSDGANTSRNETDYRVGHGFLRERTSRTRKDADDARRAVGGLCHVTSRQDGFASRRRL